ncbi:DUF4235 domain-containing protein [Streptacidiphilus sp. ASG 303]|uniref:DUF4235 domain-containing protein n=1 Tax=Streptacidiphilus sp. ASG 303 TaxID=2896847 RepID=UPI001E5D28BB|nr:DUF4235 domain-containing protein [Streptacidiphilus sp. ASG 303]MCD0483181.1 DUF4235 domain-containing protein [Streptacidiphilus sp. ASG 303]
MNKAKVVYKPVGVVVGMAGGALATAVFSRIWGRVGSGDEAPEPLQRDRGWGEVLLAAALQGAVFGLVRAVVERGGAEGWSRVTGSWPGD